MRAIAKVLSGIFGNPSPLKVVEPVEAPKPTPPREVTLGSLINAKERAERAAEQARIDAEHEAYKKRIAIERVEVVRFLEAVKVSFTHDIKQGRRPHSVMIPDTPEFNTASWRFDKMLHRFEMDKHPHKRAFDNFFIWVKSQRLYVGLFRREDGRYYINNWAAQSEDKF